MKRLGKLLGVAVDRLSSAAAHLGTFCILIMAGLIAFEVISRKFFSFSTLVADEVSGYLLLAVAFLGMAYCLRSGGHVYMETIIDRTPSMARNAVRLVTHIVAIVYTSLTTYSAYQLALDSYRMGTKTFGSTQMPLYLPEMIVPIGMALLTLQLIVATARVIVAMRSGITFSEREPSESGR